MNEWSGAGQKAQAIGLAWPAHKSLQTAHSWHSGSPIHCLGGAARTQAAQVTAVTTCCKACCGSQNGRGADGDASAGPPRQQQELCKHLTVSVPSRGRKAFLGRRKARAKPDLGRMRQEVDWAWKGGKYGCRGFRWILSPRLLSPTWVSLVLLQLNRGWKCVGVTWDIQTNVPLPQETSICFSGSSFGATLPQGKQA